MTKLSLFVGMVVAISLVPAVSCVNKEVPVTETYYDTEYKTEYRTETYTETEDIIVEEKEGITSLTPGVKWQGHLYGSWYMMKAPVLSTGALPVVRYYGYDISADRHSKSHVKITYSYAGLIPADTYLHVHDLNDVGQVFLPTNFEFGKSGQYEWTGSALEWDHYNYVQTAQELEWLESYHSIVGEPDKPERILASYEPGKNKYESECEDCSVEFDAQGVKEFAIITRTESMGLFKTTIKISSVQLIWTDVITEKRTVTKERQVPCQVPYQVEKQRTVTKTKKMPIWEAMLTGGTPTTYAPEEEAQTEYVNEDYGFSVKYPSDWVERPELVTSPFHVAVFGVVDYTPGIAIVAADADAPISIDWLIESYQEMGNSNVKILSPLTETILADGTKATTYKANYIAASGYEVTAFCLDTDKGNKRIRLVVWTVDEYVPYDEAKFSEIAHTLRFTTED
ncbi:MAG: hypothetical protein JXB43_08250 [Dehalococcoidia bacterium]|nr:hypothetical protein [Dehalococcoidia bacterium]